MGSHGSIVIPPNTSVRPGAAGDLPSLNRTHGVLDPRLKSFHDAIIRDLTTADAILLLGLGQPKHQSARFITEQGSHLGHIAHTDTVPRPTEAELIAHAEAFFHAVFEAINSQAGIWP